MFARQADPCADKPVLRKKMAYLEEQVNCGRADWIDSADPRKGIIARELLPIFERPVETVGCESLDGSSYFNLKRVPTSPEWKNPTIPRPAAKPEFRENWDWEHEPTQLSA